MAKKAASIPYAGTEFVDASLAFPAEMYLKKDQTFPEGEEWFVWIDDVATQFWKISFGANERSKSKIVSGTYKGGKVDEPSPVLSMHGKSSLSALKKLYVFLECLGALSEGIEAALDYKDELEARIQTALGKLLD